LVRVDRSAFSKVGRRARLRAETVAQLPSKPWHVAHVHHNVPDKFAAMWDTERVLHKSLVVNVIDHQ
jgi:hypothetical protein